MKKILSLVFIVLATAQIAFSQQAIAKIKYEEAEEAYAANNFKTTVSKLTEAESLLKSTNPRILYLKILAQSKIIEQNVYLEEYTLLNSTRILSDKYLKEYENLPDNDDKYRDIYKVSEQLKKYPISELDFNIEVRKTGVKFYRKKEYKNAFIYCSIAAQKGDDTANYCIGLMYLHNLGIEKDYSKAFDIFNKLSFKKHAGANNSLGYIYQNGWGQKQDFKLAFKYFELSANQESKEGQANLGDCYDSGIGCTKDIILAQKYYQLSASQGFYYAQYHLGLQFYFGVLGSKDITQAEKYFKLSSDQGYPRAHYYLGLLYFDGEGVIKDWVKADKYFRAVILSNFEQIYKKEASQKLAEIYRTGGFGIKKDKTEAKKWESISQ